MSRFRRTAVFLALSLAALIAALAPVVALACYTPPNC